MFLHYMTNILNYFEKYFWRLTGRFSYLANAFPNINKPQSSGTYLFAIKCL